MQQTSCVGLRTDRGRRGAHPVATSLLKHFPAKQAGYRQELAALLGYAALRITLGGRDVIGSRIGITHARHMPRRHAMQIVVIGGTGLIGSKLVTKLKQHGHEAVAASPKSGVNAVTGEGLAAALAGADVVVDVANAPSWEPAAVLDFFQRSSTNLVAAEAAAGVKHHVALSIVGTERSPDNSYFRAKLAQETIIKSSSVPYSIVRATQFFEFLGAIAETAVVEGKIVVPSALFQPIAAEDVADRLAEVAMGRPLNGTIDIAGPEKAPFNEFIARRLKASGDTRPVVGDPKAPYYGAPIDDTSLNPLGEARLGKTPLATWLARL